MHSNNGDENACKAESLSESSHKARAKWPLIKHIWKARQISLPSQPLSLELANKFLPSKAEYLHKRSRTLQNPPDNHSSQAAAIFIANSVDLMEQIFLYLPPKTLICFRSVSKKWLSIISDPAFCRLHSRFYPAITGTSSFATTPEALFLFGWHCNRTPEELNFLSLSDRYVNPMCNIISHLNNLCDNGKILDFHSCNGLLAVVFELNDRREFVVYNPMTRQHRLIPQLNNYVGIDRPRDFEALNIVFDPSKSDHYKLVYVWWEKYPNHTVGRYGFSVYASKIGVWRDSKDTLPVEDVYLSTYFGNGVLWNGDLHWVSDWKYTLCFQLDKECLKSEMPSLPAELSKWALWYFGESNGCLYVIAVKDPSQVLFDVFEMARDYSKWVLKYNIDLAPIRVLYPSMVDEFFAPIDEWQCRFGMPFFMENEKEKKISVVISLQDKVILYSINDAVAVELAEVRPSVFGHKWKGEFYKWNDTYRHSETLALV